MSAETLPMTLDLIWDNRSIIGTSFPTFGYSGQADADTEILL